MEKMGITGILRLLLVAALLCTVPAATSFAQTNKPNDVLKKFEEAGSKVSFIGSAYGMDGWMVTDPKGGEGVQTVYTTPEGALIVGLLFSPDGTSETQKQMEAYQHRISGTSQKAAPGAEKSSEKSEKLYAETEAAGWARLGASGAPYLYMFMNVSCDHCQNFWKDLENTVKAGKLQVRLVPFGKTPENRDGGAALLSVDNPEAAWAAYLGGDKAALGKDKIKDGAYAKLDANTAMANTWKLAGPPFTLYRRPGDGVLTAIVGRPENTLRLLAEFLK